MTFRPAASTQLMVTTVVVSAVLLGMALLFLFLNYQYRARGPIHFVFLFSGCLMLLMFLGSFCFRIRSYQIESGNLTVNIGFSKKIFSLAGLQDSHVEEAPFRGTRKEMGMSGVWSASGSFSNQRFGRFHAYASDMSRGVLLTWPDKKLLVTPEDSAQFIQSLGAAY